MTHARLTPLAAALPSTVPFVGPEEMERQRGAPFTARLGANENGFGCSPRAVAAMQAASEEIWKYGDSSSHDLREALAAFWSCRPENIVVGQGIDGLLGDLVRLTVAPGDSIVTSLGGYPTFNYHVAGYGGTIHTVPYRDDHEDLPALIARAAEVDAKLVYFANPDNPMGNYLPGAKVAEALEALPEGTLLILDEAYAELAPEDAATPVAMDDPRVIRMRTFSKGYGMAGARVGYAIAEAPLIAAFDKVRNHFGMNRTAQIGALAALQDQDWLAHIRAEVASARERIGAIAAANGLNALPSATNFVAIDCGRDGAHARALVAAFAEEGIFIRMPGVAPLDRCIRISCGPAAELDRLEAVFPQVLARVATPA
ncbi:pyridoxal phosphate-dependent aminotransferase [Pseudooceanicola sp. CBS1P-1]|uniref:Pyridoxal phosphate-dependent aminotransferase n=1 Tax=Pseudooceanicola albus TaxID=2692189 RepID=A0A6L7G6P3_9RHOB|nr:MULTISPECIES: pyridoxal phosphate-dependent aminotransferase [Pseudooceanicola]MBT9385610.1 pyridoxal phosphate-dependent aminotransferase [Pseudooceanicola endophyticus]MXN18980.1 pyridoxal phosphate-dependent aminotransferase [Pseudooceanicola albus]